MPATLKVTHKAIGAEVRRAAYEVEVDGRPVGSVEMNNTLEIPVALVAGRGQLTGRTRSRDGGRRGRSRRRGCRSPRLVSRKVEAL